MLMHHAQTNWWFISIASLMLLLFYALLAHDRPEAANLKQYSKHTPKKVIVDLSQMAKNGRGRPSPLPTLLTTSGRDVLQG